MITDEQFEKAIVCCTKGECAYCPNGKNNASGEIVCRQRLLALMPDYIKRHKAKEEQICKETAKEIFIDLLKNADNMERQGGYPTFEWLKVKARQRGVDVE